MSDSEKRSSHVLAWPLDPDASQALREWLPVADRAQVTKQYSTVLAGYGLDFTGADLSGLDLTEAGLTGARLAAVRAVRCCLYRADLSGADLSGADLTGSDLRRIQADQLQAPGAVLRSADLFAAHLRSAALPSADLRDARMNSARLLGADLSGADLRGASLRGARFGTQQSPTIMTGARVFGTALDGAGGVIHGPVDIGAEQQHLIDGPDLLAWLREQGATDVDTAPARQPPPHRH